jgi:hypothetical protein
LPDILIFESIHWMSDYINFISLNPQIIMPKWAACPLLPLLPSGGSLLEVSGRLKIVRRLIARKHTQKDSSSDVWMLCTYRMQSRNSSRWKWSRVARTKQETSDIYTHVYRIAVPSSKAIWPFSDLLVFSFNVPQFTLNRIVNLS